MTVTPVSDNCFQALLHDSLVCHDPFPLRSLRRLLLGVVKNEGQSKCTDHSENHERTDNDKASKD